MVWDDLLTCLPISGYVTWAHHDLLSFQCNSTKKKVNSSSVHDGIYVKSYGKSETFSISQEKNWRPRKEVVLSSQAAAVGPPVHRATPWKESRLPRLVSPLGKSCRHAGSTAFSTEEKHSSNWSTAGFPGPVTHPLFWRHRFWPSLQAAHLLKSMDHRSLCTSPPQTSASLMCHWLCSEPEHCFSPFLYASLNLVCFGYEGEHIKFLDTMKW